MVKYFKKAVLFLYKDDPQMVYFSSLDELLSSHINPKGIPINTINILRLAVADTYPYFKPSFMVKLEEDGLITINYNKSSTITDKGCIKLLNGGYQWEYAKGKFLSHCSLALKIITAIGIIIGALIALPQLIKLYTGLPQQ